MSDTTPGIDAADIVSNLAEQIAPVLKAQAERQMGYSAVAIDVREVATLLTSIDTLAARLAGVERERDAARRVVDAVKYYATDTEFVVDTWHRVEKAIAALDALTADATEEATDE